MGFGNAYIEFTSTQEAKRARKHIHLMRYDNRLVECEFHDENKFERNDFRGLEKIQLEIRGAEFEGVENLAIEFNEPGKEEI